METRTCLKCGAMDPEHTLRCFAVKVSATPTTRTSGKRKVSATVTTETLSGVERCDFCTRCIRKKRLSHAMLTGLGALLLTAVVCILLAAIFIKGEAFARHASTVYTVIGIIAALLGLFAFAGEMHRETPFIAVLLLKRIKGAAAKGIVYVPTDSSLYLSKDRSHPDLGVFKSRTGLKTGIGDAVFTRYIATGTGDAAVDRLIARQEDPADAIGTLAIGLDIDKLGGETYARSAGRAVARAVPAAMLEGVGLLSGDSKAARRGSVREFIVALRGRTTALDAVETRLRASPALTALLSPAGIRRDPSGEPLSADGTVQNGVLNDPPGGRESPCAAGFRDVWKQSRNA